MSETVKRNRHNQKRMLPSSHLDGILVAGVAEIGGFGASRRERPNSYDHGTRIIDERGGRFKVGPVTV